MELSGALQTYIAYKFASLIKKPFSEWEVYKMGLIDEDGEIVRKASTKEEKDAMNYLTNMVRKIKKILVKYIGDNKIANFVIAAYLLKKEDVDYNPEYDRIKEEINNELSVDEVKELENILTKMVKQGY